MTLFANAVSKPSLQKVGPHWVLWEFLDVERDMISIISMSSHKMTIMMMILIMMVRRMRRRVIIVRMIMNKTIETCSTSSPCRP